MKLKNEKIKFVVYCKNNYTGKKYSFSCHTASDRDRVEKQINVENKHVKAEGKKPRWINVKVKSI